MPKTQAPDIRLLSQKCGYHPHVFFEENTNPCFQSKIADKFSTKLQELMTIYYKNLHHA